MGYFIHNDCLVVAGGFDSKGDHVDHAEFYEDESDVWIRFESPIDVRSTGKIKTYLTRVDRMGNNEEYNI